MEPHALDISLYKNALVVLGAAGVVIPLFHRLRVSSVLGFMLVGIVVGPFGIASLAPRLPWLSLITITGPELIEPIADLGVVLLLFMIGLELSFERLWLMRRLVFGLGGLQVVSCASVLAAAAVALGYSWNGAVVIGLALAMSSTAVAIQVLAEEKRLNTPTGRTAFAVLLFQDLAVVPVLFAVGALDSPPMRQVPSTSVLPSARRCWRSPPSLPSAGWCCARCSAAWHARAARNCSWRRVCWW